MEICLHIHGNLFVEIIQIPFRIKKNFFQPLDEVLKVSGFIKVDYFNPINIPLIFGNIQCTELINIRKMCGKYFPLKLADSITPNFPSYASTYENSQLLASQAYIYYDKKKATFIIS